MNMLDDAVKLLEVQLFDQWVLERRAGRTVDIGNLAEQLPLERRAAFVVMLQATQAFQQILGIYPPEA